MPHLLRILLVWHCVASLHHDAIIPRHVAQQRADYARGACWSSDVTVADGHEHGRVNLAGHAHGAEAQI